MMLFIPTIGIVLSLYLKKIAILSAKITRLVLKETIADYGIVSEELSEKLVVFPRNCIII